MDYLGLLALGAFLGSVSALGVRYINSVDTWQKVLLAILPAVLSGVTIAFVDRFKYSPAIGCYPLGLVVAFLWIYSDIAVKNIAKIPTDANVPSSGGFKGQRAIGVLHLAASTLATLAALAIALPPAVAQIKAEWNISDAENRAFLMKQRDLILNPPKGEDKPKPKEQAAAKPPTGAASTASGTTAE